MDVTAVIAWLPEGGFEPDQAPEAEQLFVYNDDHVSVVEPPLCSVEGDALSDTEGGSGAPDGLVAPDVGL